MKRIWSLFLVLAAGGVNAADNFPATCNPVAVQKDSPVLQAKQAQVVLIHNISTSDLWITHPVKDPGASAGWSSHLEADNWSALVVDKDSFELNCIESKPGHEQQVPCVGLISVCEWPGVKIPADAKGTFWAGENLPLQTLTAQLGGHGYGLPVSKN